MLSRSRLGENWGRSTHQIRAVQVISARYARARFHPAKICRRNMMALPQEGEGCKVEQLRGESRLILTLQRGNGTSRMLLGRKLRHRIGRGSLATLSVIKREFRLRSPTENRDRQEEKDTFQTQRNCRVASLEHHLPFYKPAFSSLAKKARGGKMNPPSGNAAVIFTVIP
jgi:hypothetical protein